MRDLSAFPITKRWPVAHPDRLQLYSVPTPNGVKVSIMLEEIGLPYEPHLVDFGKNDQKTPEFLSLNPNGKIPAIIDPDGPGGRPLGLFESGAILQYLGEKTGKLLPADPARRWETIEWVHRILKEERDLVIASPPLEATSFQVENIRMAYVFYESGLSINVMYTVDGPEKRAVGFKLSDGMDVPEELESRFKFARQKSKLAGTIRGSYFVIKNEH